MYLAGWLLRHILSFPDQCAIMEGKLDDLVARICQSKCEFNKKLAKLKYKVTMAQKKTPLDLARKMNSLSYQFKKSHEQ